MSDQDFQQIIDSENPFHSFSERASPDILRMIEDDKLRRRERKPPARAVELAQQQKELSIEGVRDFRFDGQELLTDDKSRLVNFLSVKDFMIKLLATGVNFYLTDSNYPGMLGLWAGQPDNPENQRFVCSIQYPWMPEWSVIRLDEHQLPVNYKNKGWRTVNLQIIREHILNEEQVDRQFGAVAALDNNGALYRKQLYNIRNGK